jgi:hypothetical protein
MLGHFNNGLIKFFPTLPIPSRRTHFQCPYYSEVPGFNNIENPYLYTLTVTWKGIHTGIQVQDIRLTATMEQDPQISIFYYSTKRCPTDFLPSNINKIPTRMEYWSSTSNFLHTNFLNRTVSRSLLLPVTKNLTKTVSSSTMVHAQCSSFPWIQEAIFW